MRSPLYEKAKAVVAAYDANLAEPGRYDAIGRSIWLLRAELREIDQALAVLDTYRESIPAEPPHGTGRP